MVLNKIKQRWGKFINPVPRGTTTFHGDMDKYRAAVNAKMKDAKGLNEKVEMEVDIKNLLDEIHKLNGELDTARKAMAKQYGKSAAKEVEYENRIKELEKQVSSMRVIGKEGDYNADMKGIKL